MPPKGNPYKYTRGKIRRNVPKQKGIYWIWSFGDLVRIGQSKNLRSRLLDYSPKDPNFFQYDTVSQYFTKRESVQRPPSYDIKGKGTVLDKIEHTEFTWYEHKYGELPQWNKYQKHYEVGVFEELLSNLPNF
jgi:hypothetical protein